MLGIDLLQSGLLCLKRCLQDTVLGSSSGLKDNMHRWGKFLAVALRITHRNSLPGIAYSWLELRLASRILEYMESQHLSLQDIDCLKGKH